MAPKNKKGQKVLLTDFLADTSTGRSWADEMDELPTAPAPRDPNEPPNSGLGGSHLSRGDGNRYPDRDYNRRGGDRDGMERPTRVEVPVPDKPPYNAFVGNLSWEVGSTELEEFFGASHIISIRLITDGATGKPKGYGYVEFDDRDALVAATDKSGRELGGRPVRISVAEPPKEREDRTGGAWRREGPLPTFDDNRRTRHSSHQDRSSIEDVDRGERMGFGSKFVPAAESATNLTRRTQSGRGYSRAEGGFGMESEAADRGERMGFGSKFVASVDEPRKDRGPPQRGSNFIPSRATPVGSDDGHSASGGSIRRAPMLERKSTEIEPTPADTVSNWRKAKPVAPSEHEASPTAPPTAPPTRRKLELSARTVTSSDGTLTPPTSLVSNKPSPFGAAKPIDTAEREKAIQEKLDRERAELAAVNAKKITTSTDGKSTPEVEPKLPSSAATPAAPKAPKPNPFGAAKPVDTLQKELEIEQKLEREKALLEEKLKKEAQETKAVPSISTNTKGPSNAAASHESTTTTASVNQSSHTPPTPATQPRSRWTQPPPISKPATNGNVPPSAPSAAAPPPVAKSATSPLSPSLSSFRKEGISFAALAKTAAANPTSNPATTTTSKPSTKEEQSSKSMAQPPRTILKRVEGLEIKHE
ncbi:uncharacterized protein PGTG_17244 [Puccinia graminis f. sp. tritici CRL 75-36-700-3]|uniref:RRM domain-containing protein n=1 Tax=Puccinia graminis f. sp. tritici (strain CRL 75-36-700-3 / race SCCL) TaxID=418459 RepID=E3L347_PUCGT|nr:uncharacterized protein PGTG_17244 [Puccinia graminis f. sp. tritici CRL 75-36-700-3]EFP90972.2 hypothetical protein PGTG_17244 [Puccinia graminis f. sp. tritici CRL 75-36-700-3]